MPGFTAFNAHASQALAPVTGASPEAHDTSSSRRKLMTRRQPARKKTATTRDMEQTTADDTTRKPISGKDIKRTSHPGDKPEVKRRKSGSVKSSMSTTKSAVGATRTADSNEVKASKDASHSSTEAASVSLTSMAKLNGFRYNSGQAARPVDPQTVQSTSISYAPETSMIIFQRSLPQTTMQAVRNSSRGSSLLYSSSATPRFPSQGSSFSLPLVGPTPTFDFSTDSRILFHGARLAPPSIGPTPTLGFSSDSSIPSHETGRPPPSVGPSTGLDYSSGRNLTTIAVNGTKLPPASTSTTSAPKIPDSNVTLNPSYGAAVQHSYEDSLSIIDFSTDSDAELEHSHGHLPSSMISDTAAESIKYEHETHAQVLQSDLEEFANCIEEELDEDDVIGLSKRVKLAARGKKSPPSRARKLNIRDTHAHDDYGGALLSDEEMKLLDAIKVPQDARKPIVRTKFLSPIMDRTSLFGVSNTSALRTCFRVGEALNAGCHAVRNNCNLVLELYARVTSSWREPKPSGKQHFIINDLYHDKPPFINGTFELWGQSVLWEQDSKLFLRADAAGIMCRMIARMKRDGTKWRLEILSIWQVDWEDVEYVAGIYAKPTGDEGL